MDNFNLKTFINENNLGAYANLEAKKRDVDGDGDIDSDDYMAAKDAAIKKAMGKDIEEEIGDGTFDEKMLNLTKAASIMNSYVKEFGGEEEQRMFRKIYMDLDDFENFMAYGTPDGALEEDLDAVKLSDTL